MPTTAEQTREKMVAYRAVRGIKFAEMARRCGTSAVLLGGVENGWITHPNIAARICAEYELDVDDYNTMVHEDYRVKKLPKPKPKPGKRGYSTPEPYGEFDYDNPYEVL